MLPVPLPLLFVLRPDIDCAALDAALSAANSSAPAVAAAVVKDGKTVWTGTKGCSADTVFRIASLTKAFTATLVLQLVNEKKVALDDLAAKTVPLPEAWRGVTVRQLLNHTSGIPSYTNLPDFAARLGERWTPAQIVARTADKPLDSPPGTKFAYNNTGYVILGQIVEKLDRRPFADALRRRILKPLGMNRTRLDEGGDKAEALGFKADGKPANPINMTQPYAAGSIVSTANDMAKWLAAQGSTRLLPQRLWEEAWKPGTLADGKSTGYGFGWQEGAMNGVPTIEHSGGIPGFSTWARRVPSKGLAVVILTNSENGVTGIPGRILEAADPALKTPTVADPDPKITETTLKMLHAFERGEPDKAAMTPDLAAATTPDVVAMLKARLSEVGKFEELRLVAVNGPKRTYHARYEKLTVKLVIARDPEGRFSAFGLSPL